MSTRCHAIIGTVGVPGAYGGFETLAENLVRHHAETGHPSRLVVYCSARGPGPRPSRFLNAELRHLPLDANGMQSIPYDIWSMLSAVRRGSDTILILGVSGALFLPVLRLVSRVRIVTNIDGIEWRREKWKGLARHVLRWSERAAVRWSHVVVADNQAIAEHVNQVYCRPCSVIPYGGDHAVATPAAPSSGLDLPADYALALCRIEPENNVAMILEAFARMPSQRLVFVGNWDNSAYGRRLRNDFADTPNLWLCDPVYDPGRLRHLRDRATLYVHGHSAGGTNPALVEMMHFGIPVVAHGCIFNRHTTDNAARYFLSTDDLIGVVEAIEPDAAEIGARMRKLAQTRYTWREVAATYFVLLDCDEP